MSIFKRVTHGDLIELREALDSLSRRIEASTKTMRSQRAYQANITRRLVHIEEFIKEVANTPDMPDEDPVEDQMELEFDRERELRALPNGR
jgi:hypothetical protein